MNLARVMAVENGQCLELRIKDAIAALKSEGYKFVELVDCVNISGPKQITEPNQVVYQIS